MRPEEKKWTALEILNATIPFFEKKSISNPRLNSERLLAHILKLDRIGIYLQFERVLSKTEISEFRDLVRRRADGEPLQYLLGEAEFMGLSFYVTPHVLIPRPETEILVNEALALKSEFKNRSVTIWDIGTGSGCIAVSLAHYWDNCRIIASDISTEALSICEKNCTLNKVENKVKLLQHNILEQKTLCNESIDIIVSNPPYISKEELKSLDAEISEFEPQIALTDFDDGLTFYKKLLDLDFNVMGCKYVLLEMSGTQTKQILEVISSKNMYEYFTINDLNQIPRVLKIRTGRVK